MGQEVDMEWTEFDARPLLAGGTDPYDRIMEAWQALPSGRGLAVLAPFEPRPLMMAFSGMGVRVAVRQEGEKLHRLLAGPKP